MNLVKLLNNKYLLYFIVFLAITNILGYLVTNKLNAVIFFTLVSLLTYQFSKNMIIVLLVALLSTNLLMANRTLREGLEGNTEVKEEDKLENVDPELKKGLDALKKSKDVNEAKEILEKYNKTHDVNNPDMNKNTDNDSEPEGATESMTNNKSKQEKSGNGSRLDYSATLEQAYDNLDSILGSDGINKLSEDTKRLMQQQQKLFDTMQNMTPMLEQAKGMLKGFDLNSLSGLAGLASSFNNTETFNTKKSSTQKQTGTQKQSTRKFAM
jgi:hypothetical protein